jgi:hypothetical protein
MTETPCEKKDEPGSPCSEPPTDTISQIMEAYNKMDSGELSPEDAGSKITEILKANRQKKLDCLKKLGL